MFSRKEQLTKDVLFPKQATRTGQLKLSLTLKLEANTDFAVEFGRY